MSPSTALHIAGAAGRLRVFDFSFSLTNTYTFWSGVIGGTFLMLSYFGTDQSQVQRYLAAKSVDEARSSLLISAYWKIPLQALVLLIGVLVFVFYQFERPPLLFNPAHERAGARRAAGRVWRAGIPLRDRHRGARHRGPRARRAPRMPHDAAASRRPRRSFQARDDSVSAVRTEALALATRVTGQPSKDVNYIIPRFVLDHLPIGLAGLFIAAVIAAAMNAISGELNSLSTTTVIDFYRRWVAPRGDATSICSSCRASRPACGASSPASSPRTP